MGNLLFWEAWCGDVLKLLEGRPDICGRAHETDHRLVVVLANDYSMEIALSPRGGPGEFMRTVGGMPAIAAGWENAYRHNTVR